MKSFGEHFDAAKAKPQPEVVQPLGHSRQTAGDQIRHRLRQTHPIGADGSIKRNHDCVDQDDDARKEREFRGFFLVCIAPSTRPCRHASAVASEAVARRPGSAFLDVMGKAPLT
jgi:hypothetical protein